MTTCRSKICFKCQKEFPLDAFYRHAMMADGHLNKCKSCTKKDSNENRANNLSYCLEYDRQRANLPHRVSQRNEYRKSERGLAVHRVLNRQWKERNPHKKRAQTLVGNAIRAGKMVRKPCEVCGVEKAQAHHDDYSKPLDVRWLCTKHHAETHKKMRRGA